MKVALVVGHKPTSPGAMNQESGVTEYGFNNALALDISAALEEHDIHCRIVQRNSYKELPFEINEEVMPDCVVSLHCNAYDGSATGTEVLYYHSSAPSKRMAEIFQSHLVEALRLRNRGTLPRHTEDRGGYLLRHTLAPAVICEPFFIDNHVDFKVADEHYEALVNGYVNAIVKVNKEVLGG